MLVSGSNKIRAIICCKACVFTSCSFSGLISSTVASAICSFKFLRLSTQQSLPPAEDDLAPQATTSSLSIFNTSESLELSFLSKLRREAVQEESTRSKARGHRSSVAKRLLLCNQHRIAGDRCSGVVINPIGHFDSRNCSSCLFWRKETRRENMSPKKHFQSRHWSWGPSSCRCSSYDFLVTLHCTYQYTSIETSCWHLELPCLFGSSYESFAKIFRARSGTQRYVTSTHDCHILARTVPVSTNQQPTLSKGLISKTPNVHSLVPRSHGFSRVHLLSTKSQKNEIVTMAPGTMTSGPITLTRH